MDFVFVGLFGNVLKCRRRVLSVFTFIGSTGTSHLTGYGTAVWERYPLPRRLVLSLDEGRVGASLSTRFVRLFRCGRCLQVYEVTLLLLVTDASRVLPPTRPFSCSLERPHYYPARSGTRPTTNMCQQV